MRNRLSVFILVGVALIFALLFAREILLGNRLPREKFSERKLRLLTYATFVSPAGPGGEIIADFKKTCHCDIEVVTANDAGILLERLKLAPASVPFDIVLGIDQFALADAAAQSAWKPMAVDASTLHSEALPFGSSPFVPFDWSPLTFIYRQGEVEPPDSFADLANPRYKGKFALQDPRASSPGLQFFNWVREVEGEHTSEFLEKFKPNVQSVSPSWSFAYGLFMKKQASFVFSYLTSLAYHWGVQKDRGFQAVAFNEGHPVQVEFAAVPASCRECELARSFVQALLTTENQERIMKKNFMFPARKDVDEGEIFSALPHLKLRDSTNSLGKELHDWDQVFKH